MRVKRGNESFARFVPLKNHRDEKRKGAQEVLEMFFNAEARGEEVTNDEDDTFVIMVSWGAVLLLLCLFCVRWLDGCSLVESCSTMIVLL